MKESSFKSVIVVNKSTWDKFLNLEIKYPIFTLLQYGDSKYRILKSNPIIIEIVDSLSQEVIGRAYEKNKNNYWTEITTDVC